MHILYVTLGYKPAYRLGGPIWSVSALAEGMVKRGHRVTVFATNSNFDENLDVPVDQPVDVDGVEVWYFRRSDWLAENLGWLPYLSQSVGYLYTPALKGVMQEMLPGIDVVHTQMPFIYPTRAAGAMAIRANKPFFYNARGSLHPRLLRRRGLKKRVYIELFERKLLDRADGLIALTPDERGDYDALRLKAPCHVVPNGVNPEAFGAPPSESVMREFSIAPDAKLVLFLGRLHLKKGADIAVDAFIRIADRFSDAMLVMAGPDEHGLQAALEDRIRSSSASGRVRFVGLVAGETKSSLLARADIFVLPSEGEGMPMAVLEALASRTPVVISPECNMPEVGAAGAGIVAERGLDSFASAMGELLGNEAKRADCSEKADALVKQRYAWGPIVTQLEGHYQQAITKRRVSKPPRA